MKIPGLSFSWRRALGITGLKRDISRATGVPATRGGVERKIGRTIIDFLFGRRSAPGKKS